MMKSQAMVIKEAIIRFVCKTVLHINILYKYPKVASIKKKEKGWGVRYPPLLGGFYVRFLVVLSVSGEDRYAHCDTDVAD